MARSRPQRLAELGDAAIRVLAGRGRHALTHRAVDAEAGLPDGSTSYYARTRDALLALAVDRIAELDAGTGTAAGGRAEAPPDVEAFAGLVAAQVHAQLHRHRDRTLARYELSLEAVHNPDLRAALNRAGQPFRAAAGELLAALGSADPARHGRLLVAACDGIVFDALAGAGAARPPTRREIRDGVEELLRGMLAAPAVRERGPRAGSG